MGCYCFVFLSLSWVSARSALLGAPGTAVLDLYAGQISVVSCPLRAIFTCALGAEGAVCDEVGIAVCVFSCHTFEVNLPVRAACILSYCKSLQSLILLLRTLKYYPESCMIVKANM